MAKTKKARGEEAVTYRYVGKSHLAMVDRGALHLADSTKGMAVEQKTKSEIKITCFDVKTKTTMARKDCRGLRREFNLKPNIL